MITYWHQDIGHWLEWSLDVPTDGQYVVRFRYATASKNTQREFRIDGQTPCPAAKSIAFRSTGGFGNNPVDWKYRSLADTKGNECPMTLAQGRHRIRMTNLNDGLGLDFIALVRIR